MSTESTILRDIPAIPNWSKRVANEIDPNNREIIAYQSGKEDGKVEQIESLKKLFNANLELCCYYSSKFFDYLKNEKSIECKLATIKAESISSFHSLFVIDFEKYKNKELRTDLFKIANEFRNALKLKDVSLEISIMPVQGEFDSSEIINEGFFLQYGQDEKSSGS